MILTMTAVWLACVGIWQSNDLSRLVTVRVPVSRVSRALDIMSEQTGLHLNAQGPAADEVIFVDVTKQPVQEILKRIADTVRGKWLIHPDGSQTLVQNPTADEADKAKVLTRKLGAITKWRDTLTKNLSAPFTNESIQAAGYRLIHQYETDERSGQDNNDDSLDPIQRAFYRAIQAVDLKQALELTTFQRIVYSTKPTPSQRALSNEIVNLLISEQRIWANALAKIDWRDQQGKPLSLFRHDTEKDPEYQDDPIRESFESRQPFNTKPKLALLTVERDYWGAMQCKFGVYADGGKELISITETINEGQSNPDDLPTAQNPFHGLKLPQPDASSKAFWESDKTKSLPSNLARPFYFQTESYEPLRVGNQEALTAYARAKSKSVIACLDDSDLVFTEQDYAHLINRGELPFPAVLAEEPGWATLRPADASERFSRKSLSRYVGALVTNRTFDVLAYARLGSTSNSQAGLSIADSITDIVCKSEASLPENPLFTKLFASLSDSQFEAMLHGQKLSYRELTTEQQRLAQTIVLGRAEAVWIGGRAKSWLEQIDSTFEMPNGLFDGPGIALETANDQVIVFTPSLESNHWSSTFESPNRLETYVDLAHECGFRGLTADPSSFFKHSTRKRYTLKCYLSPNHWYAQDILEPLNSDFGPAIRYRDLTEDQQKRIKDFVPFDDLEKIRDKLKSLLKQHPELDDQIKADIQKNIDDIERRISGN